MTDGLKKLLTHIVDYAGLFPPAGLAMPEAVHKYATYRRGGEAWMLGRFVVPVGRLPEFETEAEPYLRADPALPWRLSVLTGAEVVSAMEVIHAFNQRHDGQMVIDALEARDLDVSGIAAAMRHVAESIAAYIEIPIVEDPVALIRAIGRAGARAKVRTGGVVPELFPTAEDLIRFIAVCGRENVPFKATAGLHHPVCAEYPLTYEPDSATGPMFGFFNVFMAAAFLKQGVETDVAHAILTETDPSAFDFRFGAAWRGQNLAKEAIAYMRQHVAHSFGSCSFDDPLNDLHALQYR